MSGKSHQTVEDYLASYPKEVQKMLKQIRTLIRKTVPQAEEGIAYGMPAYKLNGKPLVYFAGYQNHIGFYATPAGHEKFAPELSRYKQGKGSVQFPLNKPLPLDLIEKIVLFKAQQNESAAKPTRKAVTNKPSPDNLSVSKDILTYNAKQAGEHKLISDRLAEAIPLHLPDAENKIWHGHPVWFLNGNPIVGYSKQKPGIRLMFWSGASFDEAGLNVQGGKFKDASVFYNAVSEINNKDLKRWLTKARNIQWDYKNIIKRKGVLERIK